MTFAVTVKERGKSMSDITTGIKQLSEHIKIVDTGNGGKVIVICDAKEQEDERSRCRAREMNKKKWIHEKGQRYKCPNCGHKFMFNTQKLWKCCPICEQKMNGVKEQENGDRAN